MYFTVKNEVDADNGSLQLVTIGAYQLIAATAQQAHSKAFAVNVALRVLAAWLFWNHGVTSVAVWELLWAVVNGIALQT